MKHKSMQMRFVQARICLVEPPEGSKPALPKPPVQPGPAASDACIDNVKLRAGGESLQTIITTARRLQKLLPLELKSAWQEREAKRAAAF